MSRVDKVADFRERVAALKHDLGKYVAWQSANLGEDAWTGPVGDALVTALRGDILATRSQEGRREAAWEVWERLTRDLPRPLSDELAEVERAVACLRRYEPELRAGNPAAIAEVRGTIRAAQHTIRDVLRQLHHRLTAPD